MLVLTRKPRQQIMIGDDVVINVVEVQGENVRLAIDAPREIKIYRGEIYRAIQEENQKAATPVPKNLDFSAVMPPRES
ncbi:MAG: carbon storage regulator CsrA [Selenomonas sp.]|uniref:carbon storage regulator CsrA n=1 Tax=unclassified Selenomonas TaxID=2637378 RepID=UPI000497AF1C|nr:carbon storage regulator CsrA [Selenomonas sp.]SEH23501.1 carbon storage regulator, CsrA [Selenomonas ruminantium]